MSDKLLNWCMFAALVFLWGTSFLFTAIAVNTISPVDIVLGRVVLGSLMLFLALTYQGKKIPLNLRTILSFLIMGAVGNVMPFYLIAWGQQSIDSGMAGVIMAIMPLTTILLAHFLIDGEQINRYKLLGFVTGISGVVLLLGPVFGGSQAEFLGATSVLIAAICYASNTIIARKLPSYGSIVTGTGVLLASIVLILPFWFGNHYTAESSPDAASIVALVWLGIGPTGIATLIYYKLIERAGPTFLSNINYLIPAVAFFSGAAFLDETISLTSSVALITILSGIAISRYKTRH